MDSHLLAQWNAEIESLIIAVSVGTKEKSKKCQRLILDILQWKK